MVVAFGVDSQADVNLHQPRQTVEPWARMAVNGCDAWAGRADGRVVLELHAVAASRMAEACRSPGGPREEAQTLICRLGG